MKLGGVLVFVVDVWLGPRPTFVRVLVVDSSECKDDD